MIVEVSQFRLKPGTDEDAFQRAVEETQSGFLEAQNGFHSRELLRADDGTWMDIVRFESAETAQAAFAAFPGHPRTQNFEVLDMTSAVMSHWVLERWTGRGS